MKYDIAIIGGGPAGMMAAIKAGELGAKVILLEKNKELGVKLLITGNGRCNFTNKKNNIREFVNQIGRNGRFLFSALSLFGIDDVIEFFEEKGVVVKIEKDEKVFPSSNKAKDIKDVLINQLRKFDVKIKTNAEIKKIIKKDGVIDRLVLNCGTEIIAKKYIIATGGVSFPITGSTGDGYKFARDCGHSIINPLPALTSVILQDVFIKKLQGSSFGDVKISVYENDKKIGSVIGDIIFTDNGISGPAVMDITRLIARKDYQSIFLEIDFFPDYSLGVFDKMVLENFKKDNNKDLKNSFDDFVSARLFLLILELTKIDKFKKVNSLKKEERERIIKSLKSFKLFVDGLSGFERAYITSGGVELNEIESNTMKSKLIENLYFAGEVLDLDGPTGGYNLQICWSTGYLAGSFSANSVKDKKI